VEEAGSVEVREDEEENVDGKVEDAHRGQVVW